MRKTALAGTLALMGLAACSPSSGAFDPLNSGVGFGDYQQYLRQREATVSATSAPYSVPPQPVQRQAILPPADMPDARPSTVAAVPQRYVPQPAQPARPAIQPTAPAQTQTRAAVPVSPPVQTQTRVASLPPTPAPATGHPLAAPMRVQQSQTAAAPRGQPSASPASGARTHAVSAGASFGTTPAFNAGGSVRPRISDEQDFSAVSQRESIESDRERLARQRAQYQVIEVASVPDASVSGGPNIVAFALSTRHPVGTEMYRRGNPLRWSRWENACLQFTNQDAAQLAFLSNGGPERDRDNLDPDGDGYACWWDPTPLRQALASGN